MDAKNFRRLYVTIDDDVMSALGLDPATVTAVELRQRLREIALEAGAVLHSTPRKNRKGARQIAWEERLKQGDQK